MPTNDEILAAIPSTEPATFGEFCGALADCPAKGERAEWSALFSQLRTLENAGLVEVERANAGGAIESLMLTEDGVARVNLSRRQRATFDADRERRLDRERDAEDSPDEEF